MLRWGPYVVKHWSKDQGNVAKSSGEAELYAANYGADHGLGLQSLLRDMGVRVQVEVLVDSNAAIGIVGRIGLGKLRHIDVQDLWLQETVRKGKIRIARVAGECNDADLGTKPLHREAIEKIMERMQCECPRVGMGEAMGALMERRAWGRREAPVLGVRNKEERNYQTWLGWGLGFGLGTGTHAR